jgi:hypothetical protein
MCSRLIDNPRNEVAGEGRGNSMVESEKDSGFGLAIADASIRLVEAQAQIDELLETNRRLRSELNEVTQMWVGTRDLSKRRGPLTVLQRVLKNMMRQLPVATPASRAAPKNSEHDFQMLGALSALQQGRFTGVVIPVSELLSLDYATEANGSVHLSPGGLEALRDLRARLLNTGQYPVAID